MQGRFFVQFAHLREQFSSAPGLPFSDALSKERITEVLQQWGVEYRDRLYTPWVTLWVFLSQVLSADQSCRNAVARLLSFRVAQGLSRCSTRTNTYCDARQRLPEQLIEWLVRQTGRELQQQAPTEWRLTDRPVKLVDGSTVSMPDTDRNAAAFGKPSNQRDCVVFPVARLVAVLCLTTGAALDMALGPYRGKRSGELSLFRSLPADVFDPGDIVLADRLYGTFVDMARLLEAGVDGVFRLNAQRKADFRRGRRLGHDDQLVTWHRPTKCPEWLSPEQFLALPETLSVRQLRVRIDQPGFRVQTLVVVTTLLDPQQYPPEEIAKLYRARWHAELDLRSIKTVMQMDVLRCQSPEMVRKEAWMHLLAYNLLRSVMAAAGEACDTCVRELSFKGTLQLLNAFSHLLITCERDHLPELCDRLLKAVAEHRVGDRPDRYEPRKRKRQPKAYPRMKQTRDIERKLCLKKTSA